MFSPVSQLAFQRRTPEPVPFPQRIVGVLDRQLRQRRRRSGAERVVKGGQFAEENADRPAIRHDVVHGYLQHVFVGLELDQQRAQQQVARQVEWFSRFCLKRPPQFLLAPLAVRPAQIGHLQLQCPIPGNGLCRIPVAGDKVCTQDFVAPDDFVEAPFQRGDVERAGQPHGLAKVIDRTARLQAVEKPEALLGVGKRKVVPLRAVWNGRSLAPLRGGVERALEAFFQQRLLGIG